VKKLAFLVACLWASSAGAIQHLGNYVEDETVYFKWSSSDSSGGSITRSTDGTISVYKDDSVTQTTTGVTDTEDFDSLTGVHHVTIVTTDAFYTAGTDYAVVLSAATIDTQTVNAVLATFSIANRHEEADVTKWNGTAVATPATAGYAYCTIKDGTGTGEVDTNGGAVVSVTTAATCSALTGHTNQTGDNYTRIGATGSGLTSLAQASVCTEARLAELDGGNLPTDVAANATPAEVNAEVVDVLKTDTSTLPGQVTPTNTPTIEEMIEFLYKAWKNEKRQSGTEYQLYDPTGVTVDQKATVSDAAGVTTVEEVVSGP
jgi:hypothetical protein